MQHIGTQNIETKRLVLRKITLSDAQDLYEMVTDKEVEKWLQIPAYTGVEMAKDYISNKLAAKYEKANYYDWGIELKSSQKLVGRITVYRQNDETRMMNLVWFINGCYSGNGYVTEAAKAVVEFLTQTGVERLEAFAHIENKASKRVMEKIGMTHEGTLRKFDTMRDGSLYDADMYSIVW